MTAIFERINFHIAQHTNEMIKNKPTNYVCTKKILITSTVVLLKFNRFDTVLSWFIMKRVVTWSQAHVWPPSWFTIIVINFVNTIQYYKICTFRRLRLIFIYNICLHASSYYIWHLPNLMKYVYTGVTRNLCPLTEMPVY